MIALACTLFLAGYPPQDADPPNAFDLPRIYAAQVAERRAASALLAAGQYAAAETRLRQCVERIPHDTPAHYDLACALARQGKSDEALTSLQRAVESGYRDRAHLESDEDLATLRDTDQFRELLVAVKQPVESPAGWKYQLEPARPVDGQVLVTERHVAWTPSLGMFRVPVKFDERSSQPVASKMGEAGELVRKWFAEGTAAGNHGDLYDNHDADHSNMSYKSLPQITRVEYSDAAKQRQLHHGLQRAFLFDAVTIGNSSTALTSGLYWRSQPRFALTQPGGAERLYAQFRANQLYFYPEHRDHDPGHNGADKQGHGDVYPANTPYLVISQGSSGSDRAFMNAAALTLAAFHPEVKRELAKTGMLMPTVQMILRTCGRNLSGPDDYLTGAAHPTVFDGKQLDVVKMVSMAHAMTTVSLPPLVQLRVVEEDLGVPGRDYFDVGPRERLFDTPCAIARFVKSTSYWKRIVVSAEGSRDVHGQPLRFHWVVLRGDDARIGIQTMNDEGSIAELLIPYHERQPVASGDALQSNRVDIGVFVHNGQYYSAPGFVSFLYSDCERRTYDELHRIRTVDYADATARRNYMDPLLEVRKDWRDEYQYADDGTALGWTRVRGDEREEFTADGEWIVARNEAGQPSETRAVKYIVQPRQGREPQLIQQPGS